MHTRKNTKHNRDSAQFHGNDTGNFPHFNTVSRDGGSARQYPGVVLCSFFLHGSRQRPQSRHEEPVITARMATGGADEFNCHGTTDNAARATPFDPDDLIREATMTISRSVGTKRPAFRAVSKARHFAPSP